MANLETIEQELRQYINDAEHLSRQDKFVHLKAIFDKHYAMEKTEHLLTAGDFHEIVGFAKSHYATMTLPAQVSRREIYPSEAPHLLMIEAVISYLNKHSILKRLVKIDYSRR
jgi:hypothetical protein